MTLPTLVNETNIRQMLNAAYGTPPGIFIEVGVYKGGTAWYLAELAKAQNRKIMLFDTFEGIPFADPLKGDKHVVGDFKDTSYEEVRDAIPYATVIKGVFPDCVPKMADGFRVEPDVAFVHLDVDQYQSYIDCATFLAQYMVPGGIMWFDDCDHLAGAKRAVSEVFGDRIQISSVNNKHFVQF
jgi:O-methyltransferase